MTSSLAASFRALFPAITALAALAILGAAGFLWYSGYGLPAALGLLIGGAIVLVACFGLVAIQIENNELLAVIAETLADPAVPAAAASSVRQMPGADTLVLRPAPAPVPAAQPAPAAAAPRGRVEPVLSARRV